MNQAKILNLVAKLKHTNNIKPRKLKNYRGPEGRIAMLQKSLTALLKYERIELNFNRADETRAYAEIFMSQIAKQGSQNQKSIDMANFWILENQIIYKLFNVLVPRFSNDVSYTNLYHHPNVYPGILRPKAILELKNNSFPKVSSSIKNQSSVENILLKESHKRHFIDVITQ
uniref:Large ribosomal subunit protein bL17m n=1 Tax=Trichogramma kaykai TaxID=54128 RepID=A0ABD2WZN4_9HYME